MGGECSVILNTNASIEKSLNEFDCKHYANFLVLVEVPFNSSICTCSENVLGDQ